MAVLCGAFPCVVSEVKDEEAVLSRLLFGELLHGEHEGHALELGFLRGSPRGKLFATGKLCDLVLDACVDALGGAPGHEARALVGLSLKFVREWRPRFVRSLLWVARHDGVFKDHGLGDRSARFRAKAAGVVACLGDVVHFRGALCDALDVFGREVQTVFEGVRRAVREGDGGCDGVLRRLHAEGHADEGGRTADAVASARPE